MKLKKKIVNQKKIVILQNIEFWKKISFYIHLITISCWQLLIII